MSIKGTSVGVPNSLNLVDKTRVAPSLRRMCVGDEVFRKKYWKHDHLAWVGVELNRGLVVTSANRERIVNDRQIHYQGKITTKHKQIKNSVTCLLNEIVYHSFKEKPNATAFGKDEDEWLEGAGLVHGEPVYLAVHPKDTHRFPPDEVKVYILTQPQYDRYCGLGR